MKVFWAILLGSFVIASAIVFTRADDNRPLNAQIGPAAQPTVPAQPTPDPSPMNGDPPSDAVAVVEAQPDRDASVPETPLADASSSSEPDPQPEVVQSSQLDLDELLGIEDEPNRITPEMAIEDASSGFQGPRTLSQQATAEFAELALQASGSVEEASEIANAISPDDQVTASDDALVIGRVTIPGSGTEADPYELPWGVLISAIRTYNPRLEMTDLPGWADALNNKHVRLTGFAFLPVVASETDEVLLMLNPWDGCHMGAPPTPYDSVEVMLDEPVNMGGRNGFVTVTGKFNVDPFLVRGWLVSLYTMDRARLEFAGS
ncbi:MAG: hypothetical protein ACFHWZ_17720 [Phycisphaerales bacterium]